MVIPIGVKIIGCAVLYAINVGCIFQSSFMKCVSKVITVLCWTEIARLYIDSLDEPNSFLVIFIKLMTLAFLYPMLCQYE